MRAYSRSLSASRNQQLATASLSLSLSLCLLASEHHSACYKQAATAASSLPGARAASAAAVATANYLSLRCFYTELTTSSGVECRPTFSHTNVTSSSTNLPCVSRNAPRYFSNNSVKDQPIVIIFSIRHPEETVHRKITQLPSSPVNCFRTSLRSAKIIS